MQLKSKWFVAIYLNIANKKLNWIKMTLLNQKLFYRGRRREITIVYLKMSSKSIDNQGRCRI
jgi:hypothetical protein